MIEFPSMVSVSGCGVLQRIQIACTLNYGSKSLIMDTF